MLYWTALTLGFLGSTHCVGMCGPIALALPLTKKEKWEIFKTGLVYNLGRISTYAILGLALGILGQTVALAGWQNTFSIAMGILLLIGALFSINIEHQVVKIPLIKSFYVDIQQRIAPLFRQTSLSSRYWIGFLNGFLPCGMVYVALAGALTAGSIPGSMAFMVLFGLGTLPLMLGMSLIGNLLTPSLKRSFRKLAPVVMIGFACLLIFRGFQVELPMELRFWEAVQNPVMCH